MDGPEEAQAKEGIVSVTKKTTVDWAALDPSERLIAEQAVLAAREVRRAMEGAPHGRGLEVTENAVVAAGRRQMALVMEEMLRAKAAAEEKGGTRVPAASGRATGRTPG